MGETRGIIRAAGQIGFYTFLSRVTGLIRDIIIGSVFGAGLVTDTFVTAFRIPNLLRRMVGEGAATAALVPVVTEYLTRCSRAEAMSMVRALYGAGGVVLILLTLLGMYFAEPLAHLFAPGFSATQLRLTAIQLRIMFPYLFCIGCAAMIMGVLHALRHFAAPAFAPVVMNFILIGCGVWLWSAPDLFAQPILVLALAVTVGGVGQLLWHLPTMKRLGVPVRPHWRPRHPAVRQVGGLLLPVMFGTAIYQVNLLVTSILASFLAEGGVSALWYANRLFEFPQGVFIHALSAASLPSFALQAQRRDLVGMSENLGSTLRLVNFVVVPAAIGLAVLAVPILATFFFHGAFQVEQVITTAGALQAYTIGLWSLAVVRLLVACLYGLQDTRVPMLTGMVSLIANVCFGLMFMGDMSARAEEPGIVGLLGRLSELMFLRDLGPTGLALSTSLAAMINMGLLAFVLSRYLKTFPWRAWVSSLSWSLFASLVMMGPVWWVASHVNWLEKETPLSVQLPVLVGAISVGIVSFGIAAWPGGKREFRTLAGMLPQRALRFLPQFLQPRE